jgi:hypothetical protein
MSHFYRCRAHELVPYQLEEDAWGTRPECPVEPLGNALVWRVPPGTEVEMVISSSYRYLVTLVDDRPPAGAGHYVRIRRRNGTEGWANWRELRRIGYTPAARASDVVETAHAPR